jgi:hypothetical protein
MGNAKSGHNLSGSRVGTSPKPGSEPGHGVMPNRSRRRRPAPMTPRRQEQGF